jgi:hypothetical protein
MKTRYVKPRTTVVSFKVENGFASVYGVDEDIVLFHFLEDNQGSGRFGNDQFRDLSNDNNDYSFFGD